MKDAIRTAVEQALEAHKPTPHELAFAEDKMRRMVRSEEIRGREFSAASPEFSWHTVAMLSTCRLWAKEGYVETTRQSNAAKLLDDLYNVGPGKPMGYLPCNTIRGICYKSVEGLKAELEAGGLRTLLFTLPEECNVFSGALYAWHEQTLSAKLEQGKDILSAAGLTTDCEDYVRKIALRTYLSDPLYGFIAETFGQPSRKSPSPGPAQ